MKNLSSGFAEQITQYLDWRTALGYSRDTDGHLLARFDRYCAANYPDAQNLTREIVCSWIDSETTSIPNKTTAIRNFSKYLQAYGCVAYEYPTNGEGRREGQFLPQLFTLDELRALFAAVDNIRPSLKHPHLPIVLSAMFRLIYSCGLRPNEGRELLRDNVDLASGTIRIVNTKGKKERMVVMSDDMHHYCLAYDIKRSAFAGVNPYFFPSETEGVYSEKAVQQWFRAAFPNMEGCEGEAKGAGARRRREA